MECCRGTGPSILSCGKWVLSSKNSARILKRIMNNFLTQFIQKDCFSFYTVLESATRWRYIQGNISPFHSFCPLAPSISQKLKLFFWPILSFGDRANSANAFHREPYWSKRQAPFLLSTMKQKITWIRIWILLISCVK